MRLLLVSALAAVVTGCTCFAPQQEHHVAPSEKAIPAKKENLRYRRVADTHTRNAKPDILPKMDASQSVQPKDKPNGVIIAKPESSPKVDASPSVQPNDKPNGVVNAKPDISPKMDASPSVQSNGRPNGVVNGKPDISPKMDASPSVQPNGNPNTAINGKSTTGAKTETPQSSRLDDKPDIVMKKARATIAAKMENPTSLEFKEMKRAERKNAAGNAIDSICGYVRGKTVSGGETGDRPFLYLVQEDEAYIGGFFMATSPHHNLCK